MKQINRSLQVIVAGLMVLLLAGCGSGGGQKAETGGKPAAEKVVLKVVSAWPEKNRMNDALWMLQKKVEEKSQGKLTVQWGGGPEAIPPFQLAEALRSGVVDLAWTAHTYNVSQVPVAEGVKLSRLTPWEERSSGAHQFLNGLYQEKMNAFYLGKGTPNLQYNLYTNVEIKAASDFKGLTIRVTPAYQAFVQALGAAPVTTDPGEVYTALERKVIVGYGWPSVGITDFGWNEKTRFVIEPAFYQVDVIALANINTWKRLSPENQKLLGQCMEEVEREAHQHFGNLVARDRELLRSKGVGVLPLPPEEAGKYLDMAYRAGWDSVNKKSPQEGPQLQKMLAK
ncbi:MAG: TRAP transporter substrate-binding protein DctP [Bacillota bacterium]